MGTATVTVSVTSGGGGPPGSGTGLTAEYFGDMGLSSLVLTRVDPKVDFWWLYDAPDPSMAPDNFSARWSGRVEPLYSQTYTFTTLTSDGARLWVNGQRIVDAWFSQSPTEHSGQINLMAGQKHDIVFEFYEATGRAVAQLFWASPSQPKEIIPQSRLHTGAKMALLSSTTSSPEQAGGRDGGGGCGATGMEALLVLGWAAVLRRRRR